MTVTNIQSPATISLPLAENVGHAPILERKSPMQGATELVVAYPRAGDVQPGQFFQIGVGAPGTLLRRPYSAAWADSSSGRIGFIFNMVGAGSAWLADREPGQQLDLLGPLGHGFDLDGSGPAICIAGGLGVAVFPGVVERMVARGRPVIMHHGARTAAQLLPEERFIGASVREATDDGSAGHHGTAVDLLSDLISSSRFPPPLHPARGLAGAPVLGEGRGGGIELFACGPTPMLQALVAAARGLGIPRSAIQVALETPMGCGVGTCLGCVAPRRDGGYLLTCQDGPCVRADEMDWSRLADVFHG